MTTKEVNALKHGTRVIWVENGEHDGSLGVVIRQWTPSDVDSVKIVWLDGQTTLPTDGLIGCVQLFEGPKVTT
jgi:hypothetical protein